MRVYIVFYEDSVYKDNSYANIGRAILGVFQSLTAAKKYLENADYEQFNGGGYRRKLKNWLFSYDLAEIETWVVE